MKNTSSKIISVTMILVLVFSFGSVVFAEQSQNNLQLEEITLSENYLVEETNLEMGVVDDLTNQLARENPVSGVVEPISLREESSYLRIITEDYVSVYVTTYIASNSLIVPAEYSIEIDVLPFENEYMMSSMSYDVIEETSPLATEYSLSIYDDVVAYVFSDIAFDDSMSIEDYEVVVVYLPNDVWVENEYFVTTETNTYFHGNDGVNDIDANMPDDRETSSDTDLISPMATILTISPTTNWTNVSAAGGAQRTVTVTTNGAARVYRPIWLNIATFPGSFTLTAQQNTTTSARSGTVTVAAGNLSRSFTVSQLAGATTLTISPTTNWTNISAAGGAQRTVTVTSNATASVTRPVWLNIEIFQGSFRLTAQQNTSTSARSGTVTVTAGNLSRSFTVSQLGAATTLTISPTTNWSNISAAGGAQRTTNVTTNAPTYSVSRPTWLTLEFISNPRSFRLTAQQNTTTSPRSGTVTVTAENLSRSFTVSQLAGATTLTISPSTDWNNVPATGGTQRTVTVTSNAQATVSRPSWLTFETTANGFRLTAQQNPTTSTRNGDVTVTAGNQTRSFRVTQLAAPTTLS